MIGDLDKWAERVYSEDDFGRSVATTVAGCVGLIVHLLFDDAVISVFSAITIFPTARLLSNRFYDRVRRASLRRIEREQITDQFSRLSDEERDVVLAFAATGSAVMTWSQVNKSGLQSSAIESLIQRDMLGTSMTADGMRETFVMNMALFDVGLSELKARKRLPK